MLWLSLENTAPSLHSHYGSFITATGCSAPAMGIGIRHRGCGHLWISQPLRERLAPTLTTMPIKNSSIWQLLISKKAPHALAAQPPSP